MYRLTILYGHPTDPQAFDEYYRDVHLPIARRMRGLKQWTIGHCEAAVVGQTPPYHLIVGLYADTLEAILPSPEGRAAVDDVPNFATGGVTFLYNEDHHVQTAPVTV